MVSSGAGAATAAPLDGASDFAGGAGTASKVFFEGARIFRGGNDGGSDAVGGCVRPGAQSWPVSAVGVDCERSQGMGQTWVRSGGLHLGGRPSLNPFQVATDCEGALCGGQWFVAGQLLAVEPWVSGFMLAVKVVRRTVVWVLLLSLPMVFWGSEMLKGIVT